MKNYLDHIKRVLERTALDVIQNHQLNKEVAEEKRQARHKAEEESKMQRLREGVSGPDTECAVQIWREVMGWTPNDGILDIYAARPHGQSGSNYLSFVYRTEDDLIEALRRTHWRQALELLSDDCDHNYDSKPPPPWRPYWPFQPGSDAKTGGRPTSRPFISDCYYYYLDQKQRRIFLSTGMTHYALNREINGKPQRTEEEKQSMSRWTP
jgi:hypothetical protein